MIKAIRYSDIERYRIIEHGEGLPRCSEIITLDGTRKQLEDWHCWQEFKEQNPNNIFYYINLDEENGDPERYDIVGWATQEPPEIGGNLMGGWLGIRPGMKLMGDYNIDKVLQDKVNIILVTDKEISEETGYYIVEE